MNKSDILTFLRGAKAPATKRDIISALNIRGAPMRIALKSMLRELEKAGDIAKLPGGAYGVPTALPAVMTIEVTDIDADGDLFARPAGWEEAEGLPAPRIEIRPDGKGHPALAPGDRATARLKRVEDNVYEARILRRNDTPENRVVGAVKMLKAGALLIPVEKKERNEYPIPPGDLNGAQDQDIVIAEITARQRGSQRQSARVLSVLGRRTDAKAISLISMAESGLREEFPADVLNETKGMSVPDLGKREDLRPVPLVTIDGPDARDFDDAVFAEKDADGGFHLIVAIADVSWYVRPYNALDREAWRRGNSTYFPDRVVPMLPEALSNDLCSLRPHENRACLAVHMWIDAEGRLLRHTFVRGIMRSAARLTYERAQAAMDGITDEETAALMEPVIKPLYAAFTVLDAARQKRGALELDLPERKIVIDDKGRMSGVTMRERLDSHRLIEEFMILANVAAAQELEKRKAPCVYRIHDKPSLEKLDNVREFVASFGLSLPKGQVTQPEQINFILKKASEMPYKHLISEVVLRTQAQAVYRAENIGHFGLALQRYAHFTSPIRRYADLVVHRSLVRACGLGDGGLDDGEIARIEETCEHISATERTSMEAERSAVDRFTAAFLSSQIGATFGGRISGVTRFGLFIKLNDNGADGLVPIRSLPNDFYVHDERAHALIGRKNRAVFRLGAQVTVRLKEADGLTGSTILELVGHQDGADIPGMAMPRIMPPREKGKNEEKRRKFGNKGKKYGKKRKR